MEDQIKDISVEISKGSVTLKNGKKVETDFTIEVTTWESGRVDRKVYVPEIKLDETIETKDTGFKQ